MSCHAGRSFLVLMERPRPRPPRVRPEPAQETKVEAGFRVRSPEGGLPMPQWRTHPRELDLLSGEALEKRMQVRGPPSPGSTSASDI
jgi:hypothetical protein